MNSKIIVIKNFAPKFLDNAGWDCNVTWEIEDVDNFNASKGSAWHVTMLLQLISRAVLTTNNIVMLNLVMLNLFIM